MPDSPRYLSGDLTATASMYGGHISFNKGILSLFYMLLELEPFIPGPASITPWSRVWNVTYNIMPPISGPLRYQAPDVKSNIRSSDLPYQAPTYDIKPLVLHFQNKALTYDIKPFKLNRQYEKYETAHLPYQAPTYDIKPLVLHFQNKALTYDIKSFKLNRQYKKYETAHLPY